MRLNAYACSYGNGNPNSYLYANCHSHVYSDSNSHLYANSYSHDYPDSDGHLYANSHGHGYAGRPDAYANSDSCL